MNILTVTPNPAIDQTINLIRLTPGQVHRAESVRYNAGGKGINVSSCLADWGLTSTVTGFLGRDNAGIFETLCRNKGLGDRLLRFEGRTRTNIKIVDLAGTTDLNLPGAPVDPGMVAELESLVRGHFTERSGLAIMAGSLPPGCPPAIYRRLMEELTVGVRVILDADGQALAEALAGPVPPFAVKPNRRELSRWAGRDLHTREALVAQAEALRRQGLELVVISLGEEGALFVGDEGIVAARSRAENIVTTVGAGDAMVAGLAAGLSDGCDLERLARLSTAFSLAKMTLLGPNLPPREAVEDLARCVTIEWVFA